MHLAVAVLGLAAMALAAPVQVAVSGFRFVDCGPTNAPLHFTGVELSPDPIVRRGWGRKQILGVCFCFDRSRWAGPQVAPGNLTAQATITNSRQLTAPIAADVQILKGTMKIPCIGAFFLHLLVWGHGEP